ncbi:MAG: RluA family pseudouridine synthase [Verrucomicrobia bacterium]|nr:RluA family pseudouridine synthase [Verrucomicrobiota bacterium]
MDNVHVGSQAAGTRLDVWLSRHLSGHSRARWQALIKDGRVRVDGEIRKPNYTLAGSETIAYEIPPPEPVALPAENIPLDVIFEDRDIIVINKPAGLVVHPAAGHDSGTLVNALLHHCDDLAGIGGEYRPGIVHRLDKDTSGLIVAVKNEASLENLSAQFKARTVEKEYAAIAWGVFRRPGGSIESQVGRSPRNRKKMTANAPHGRRAVSHYTLVEQFEKCALLKVRIETGRTHQIRVHLAHIGHPIVGDSQYGRARKTELPHSVARQMLHAATLSFDHPATGERMRLECELPQDMRRLLAALRS